MSSVGASEEGSTAMEDTAGTSLRARAATVRANRSRDGLGPGAVTLDRVVEAYRDRLLEQIDVDDIAPLAESQRRARVEKLIGGMLSEEGPVMPTGYRSAIIKRIADDALGLGSLEPLLSDPSVTEVMVNGPDEIFVERAGLIERADLRFESAEKLLQVIDRIVAAVNRRVDESSPMVDARLPTGERVNVIVPPLALDGPTVTIRRFPRPYSLEQLVALGSLDEPLARLIESLIRARLSIAVSGGTGSGKTTMLNAVSAFIPAGERIITIEQTAELQMTNSHLVRVEARPPNVEGAGEVTIRDLVKNALRMRPDRIIVGEVRAGETLDMLQAMNTGHEGSLTTVHANTPADALLRLGTLASMTELDLPFGVLREQINSAIDVIIHVSRAAEGARRCREVAWLASRYQEDFRLEPLARLEPGQPGSGTVSWRHFPLPDALRARMLDAGVEPPASRPDDGPGPAVAREPAPAAAAVAATAGEPEPASPTGTPS